MPIERIEREPAAEERIRQLRELFPEVFSDGRVNVERLRELLDGDAEELGPGEEHYGLDWPGKQAARRQAARPPTATLRPAPGEGVNEDTTQNLLIVGDNLEVLRVLQKSYANRVKLIYIDPPYNTGNDFIYKDDFREPVEAYLEATAQSDFAGLLTSNPKSGGRFHSRWLSFMYSRVSAARSLLADAGSLWISIDDNELANVSNVCNELFGEENRVAAFVWEKRTTRENRKVFSVNHDYVLCYARDKEQFQAERNMLPFTEEVLGRYENPDNDPRGDWQSVSLNAQAGHATKDQFYDLRLPSGRKISAPPGRCWAVTRARMEELIADKRVWFGADGNNTPRRKVFLSEARDGLTPHTLWTAEEVGTNDSAKKALIKLFGGVETFDTPKPVSLIQRIVQIATRQDEAALIVDFFAGSGTTGEAVMRMNQTDGGNRRFLLVQLPESTALKDYPTIAEIARARLRLASKESAKGESSETTRLADVGFKVLYEVKSSVQRFIPIDGAAADELPGLLNSRGGLVPGWKATDLLVEVMLLEGYPLDSAQSQSPAFTENVVYLVAHPTIPARLLVCFDAEIAEETVEALRAFEKDVFVCLESALTDTLKVRIVDALHRVRTL